MNRTGMWQRVWPALVVAVSVGVVWGMVAGWGIVVGGNLATPAVRTYEDVRISSQGVPLIATYSTGDFGEAQYRTLDGEPVTAARDTWLKGTQLLVPPRPPRLFSRPVTWDQRLMSVSDAGRPPVGWYLIRDAEPHGHAYFAGYDAVSKRCVGYIGRDGFGPSLPPRDQWFDVGTRPLAWGDVCGTGLLQFGGGTLYQETSGYESLAPWLVFLIDGDQLLEIDLQGRTVQTLHEAPHMRSVGILPQLPAEVAAKPDNPRVDNQLAIRTADRILILDPPTGAVREYALPESLRDETLRVFAVGGKRLLLVTTSWQGKSITHFTWLAPDSDVADEKSVALAGSGSGSRYMENSLAAAVMPVPAGWLLGVGVLVPVRAIQDYRQPTYAAALRSGLKDAWPGMLAVWALSAVLAWFALRAQRKYFRPHTAMWVAFVLLLGPAGLVAYWLEQRRATLETCGACGRVVPRDREGCAACGAEFPAPAAVGTEIFA